LNTNIFIFESYSGVNINIEIIENNDENSDINSSYYKFVEKYIDRNKSNRIFFDLLDIIKDNNISIKNIFNIKDNYCKSLSINDSDWTVEERNKLVSDSQKYCDEGCTFIDFDNQSNYSKCICRMLNDGNSIKSQIINELLE
jgi:hypothetical protein